MTRTRVMSQGKEGRNADFMQTARDNPHKAEARIGASTEAGTRNLWSQSSVNVSQATLSQATLSQAMLSHATLSHATLSQATLSQATLSQAKLSQAMLFQTRVSQVSRNQGMPPNVGSFQCSGEPKRTGYSARAKPSAGWSARLARAKGSPGWGALGTSAPGTGALGTSVPSTSGTSTSSGSVASRAAIMAANASSSPLPSAIGSGRPLPLSCPYCCVVPTRNPLIWSGVRFGQPCRRSAAAPDTTPVAIDVPVRRKYVDPFCATTTRSGNSVSKVLPGTRRETRRRPGATRSGLAFESALPQAENQASMSSRRLMVPRSSVAPTVTTYGSMPGVTTVLRCGPPFPDAATTTRPRRHAISTAADIGSTR